MKEVTIRFVHVFLLNATISASSSAASAAFYSVFSVQFIHKVMIVADVLSSWATISITVDFFFSHPLLLLFYLCRFLHRATTLFVAPLHWRRAGFWNLIDPSEQQQQHQPVAERRKSTVKFNRFFYGTAQNQNVDILKKPIQRLSGVGVDIKFCHQFLLICADTEIYVFSTRLVIIHSLTHSPSLGMKVKFNTWPPAVTRPMPVNWRKLFLSKWSWNWK